MQKEIASKSIVYDEGLRIEACHFKGNRQPFPNHFHEYYVIGLIENGKRSLSCKNQKYELIKGNIILFNPGDNHACIQSNDETLEYRSFHISRDVMLDLAEEITDQRTLPIFSENVILEKELNDCLRALHQMVMDRSSDFKKEEYLLFLLSALIQKFGQSSLHTLPEYRQEIENACTFIRQHFRERLSLEQICLAASLSKSTLLRAFTKEKGITPYRYLETIRISEARALLRQGVSPAEVAVQTGFSDQSHFTNYFTSFIGLAPGVYRDIFSSKNLKNKDTKHHEK